MRETIVRVVDNRVLILSIDELYREAMMRFEENHLLTAAKKLINNLNVETINTPVEGYYRLSPSLKEYFLIIRSLQNLSYEDSLKVKTSDEYRFLSKIASSPIYGRKSEVESFFPVMKDPLYFALDNTSPDDWNADALVDKAYRITKETDDCSLVGLAALSRDAILITAFRESTVLYSGAVALGAYTAPKYVYEWNVDKEIEERASRFIAVFNKLISGNIRPAKAENAEYFYKSFGDNDILGRCVRIAFDPRQTPIRHYHWAINSHNRDFLFDEFWDTEFWTTEMYKRKQLYLGRFNKNIN